MAPKTFKQVFAKDFRGVDGLSSSIEEEVGTFNRAVNYEMSVGNSIRGRVGCQTSGSNGFFAIFPYSYTRTQDQYDILYQAAAPTLNTTKTAADGVSINKLIGLNQQVWTLDTFSVVITQVNAGAYTWYSYVNGANINFNIKKDGTSILDTSLGNGIDALAAAGTAPTASKTTTIYDLLNTINALADLSVSTGTRGTCPPFAIVNGTQDAVVGASVTYGTSYTITVNNTPHTFLPGDIICFPECTLKDYTGSPYNVTYPVLAAGMVLSVTATTIVYVGPRVTLTNGDVLGNMGQSAAMFPISTVASEASGVMTLTFPFWRLIPEGDRKFGESALLGTLTSFANKTTSSFYAPTTSVGANGNLYIASSASFSNGVANYANNLLGLDSLQVTRTGLPAPSIATAAGGAGVLAGVYRYKAFLRKYDGQGNIVDGPVSSISTITAAGSNTVTPTLTSVSYGTASGFGQRSLYSNLGAPTAIVAGTLFGVDDSTGGTAFVQPGDIIILSDDTAPVAGLTNVGTLHRTRCTKVDGTATPVTIAVADGGYTIINNQPISTGLTIVFLRTTVGGNQYYILCEMPVTGYTNFSFTDNVTDAVLTGLEQYIEVTIGKEHNAPPPCSLICQHQGGLVVARGPFTPNSVSFSTVEGIEYFPTASNSFDVPSTQSGFITAIASDTDDRLAVFKERAYYDIVGALDDGIFSVNVRNEGDYGISDQGSLVRVREKLVGLCETGFVTIRDGILNPFEFLDLNARIVNQAYQFHWAVASNDYVSRNYICSIPQVSGEPVTYVIDYSRGDVKVFERSYTTQIDSAGGQVLVDNQYYHLSTTSPYGVFRRLIRFNANSPSGNGDGDSFIDNTNAISYILESQPMNFGEPALLKSPVRLRTWSIPNDYVVEGWVPFSLLVETGASPIASYVGGVSPNATSATISFATANDVFQDVKLVKCRTHFYIVRYTTNTIRTSPFITGYEIMFAENYEKEDLIK